MFLWSLVGIVFAILATIAVRAWWGRPRRVLTVVLTSRGAAGSWIGEIPSETLTMAALQLCLLWACKVRWLLNSEPKETRPVLREVLRAVAQSLQTGSSAQLEYDLLPFKQVLQDLGLGGSPVGAQLQLHLHYTGKGPLFWILTNSLPVGSTHGDWIWSSVHLVQSATRDLDPGNTQALSAGLSHLSDIFDSPEANDKSLSTLQELYFQANDVGLRAALEYALPNREEQG